MSESKGDKDPTLHIVDAGLENQIAEVLDQLAFIRAALEELLRRVPEPRCLLCGLARGFHDQKFGGADHEFTF